MARSTEKNRAMTGNSKVPRPKPENRVKPEAKNAAKQMIRYDIEASSYPLPEGGKQ